MRLTTKTIYALQLLLALAMHARASRAPLQLREIAESRGLPFKFLEQIAIALKGAGWIHGQRGKEGGYILSTSPAELTVAQVVRLLEGDIESARPLGNSAVERAVDEILGQCRHEIGRILESATLDDLARSVARLEPQALAYDI